MSNMWTPEAMEISRELAESLGQTPVPLRVEVAHRPNEAVEGGRTMTVDEILEQHPELQRRDAEKAPTEYEANIFCTHPTGFKSHFKVISKPASIVANFDRLVEALTEAGYTPEVPQKATGGARPAFVKRGSPARRQQSAVECNACGGPTWDNRESKRNPKAPDYKCKDKDGCDDAAWIQKDGSLRWASEAEEES